MYSNETYNIDHLYHMSLVYYVSDGLISDISFLNLRGSTNSTSLNILSLGNPCLLPNRGFFRCSMMSSILHMKYRILIQQGLYMSLKRYIFWCQSALGGKMRDITYLITTILQFKFVSILWSRVFCFNTKKDSTTIRFQVTLFFWDPVDRSFPLIILLISVIKLRSTSFSS